MNLESILLEVETAIKHRCISKTEQWHIVYYHTRICCVPAYEYVPPEIILCIFTEKDVRLGFTQKVWTELSTQIVRIYKELHK